MGRTRKVVAMSTGKIGNDARKNRAEAEKKIKAKDDALVAPEWLSDAASSEFKRVVQEAREVGMLDNLDLSMIAIYADNYGRYSEAAGNLNADGPIVEAKSGYKMPSPWMSIMNQSARNIFTCSSKLGLAVTDRLKLIVPTKEEKEVNKYIKFLGDGTNA